MRRRQRPTLLPLGAPPVFPDPDCADEDGLVAIGGDLSVERLLAAYDAGIFPWYDRGLPPLWWSPNPRAIISRNELHVSRSMQRELRRGRFEISANVAFADVMRECGRHRRGGTWVLPDMLSAYCRLHELGHAVSFEVWRSGELVGGLYGVQRGGLFAAESMFHRVTSASKVALIMSVELLFEAGIELYDVQFVTPHLASMGAREIPRREYLDRVAAVRSKRIVLGL
jgi:leucyl/phenylalanyl-tRNA--protein transferase